MIIKFLDKNEYLATFWTVSKGLISKEFTKFILLGITPYEIDGKEIRCANSRFKGNIINRISKRVCDY